MEPKLDIEGTTGLSEDDAARRLEEEFSGAYITYYGTLCTDIQRPVPFFSLAFRRYDNCSSWRDHQYIVDPADEHPDQIKY